MSFTERPELSIGDLLSGTFIELRLIAKPVALYLLFFLVLAVADEPLRDTPVLGGLLALATFAGYFIGQFLLYRIALRQAGLVEAEVSFGMLRFAGMAVMLAIPIYIGTAFFIIPGIFLVSRWLISPCLLVATGRGTFSAVGESWNMTDGNTARIALAFTVMVVIFMIIFTVLIGISGAAGLDNLILVPAMLFSHVFALLMMGLSLTTFRALHSSHEALGEVFA